MIHQMSGKIAFSFSEKKIIEKDMEEVYAYGLELLIASLITGLITLSMSLVFGVFIKTILLLIPFRVIRSNAGGYHASSHLKCILSFVINYFLSVWLLSILPTGTYAIFSLLSLITLVFVVFTFGSIPNENRPVTADEKAMFEKKSKCASLILTAIGLLLARFAPEYAIYFAMGGLMAAGSMIVAKILLLKERKNE